MGNNDHVSYLSSKNKDCAQGSFVMCMYVMCYLCSYTCVCACMCVQYVHLSIPVHGDVHLGGKSVSSSVALHCSLRFVFVFLRKDLSLYLELTSKPLGSPVSTVPVLGL